MLDYDTTCGCCLRLFCKPVCMSRRSTATAGWRWWVMAPQT